MVEGGADDPKSLGKVQAMLIDPDSVAEQTVRKTFFSRLYRTNTVFDTNKYVGSSHLYLLFKQSMAGEAACPRPERAGGEHAFSPYYVAGVGRQRATALPWRDACVFASF